MPDETVHHGNARPDEQPNRPDTHRSIELTRIGDGRFKAINERGGETFLGSGGDDPDFTPVEALLAALAGCAAIDVDAITGKRAAATTFTITSSGHKVRDDGGSHLVDLRLSFDVAFPEGEGGDQAREMLPRALEMTRDRLCTVTRTVALGEPVTFELAPPG